MNANSEKPGVFYDVIASVRSQIADELLIVGSVLGIFGFFSSLSTILSVGWQLEHVGIGLAFLVYVSTAVLRKHLSYEFRASVIVGVCFALGVFNYWGWGLIGAGAVWFLATVVYATIFLNRFVGRLIFVLVIFISLLFTIAVSFLWLPQNLDFVAYANSTSSWVARLSMTIIIGWMFYRVMHQVLMMVEAQVQTAKSRAMALDKQAEELKTQVLHRSQTEARLENMLERLQFVDKSKSNFISQISHELRTPISNIKLYQELLQRRPEKSASYMPIIQEEVGRLTSIVDKMLMSTQIVEEIDFSTYVLIDLVNLMDWVISNYQNSALEDGISIHFIKPDESLKMWGSLTQVQRVVAALVDNAIKYNHGKSIEIEIFFSRGQHGIAIRNVSPYPQESMTIFEPFVRGDTAMYFQIAGAGLGLTNARRIVEYYGGSIEMKAIPMGDEEGLEFCVWLPIAREAV